MEKLPKVAIIMSTYNGEKYVGEQIDSILKQNGVNVDIHIFDDRSTDNTVNVIKEYTKKHKNIYLTINETNKNFTYNFLDGLFSLKDNNTYDYYAFADQDDWWVEDKIISAIDKINAIDKCTLYSSNLKIVDGLLQPTGKNYDHKIADILQKNCVTGCTAVMDKAFKELVTLHYPKNTIYLHDYWVALIANLCKDAHYIYDKNAEHILYRQHGTNQIGVNNRLKAKLKRYMQILFKKVPYERTTTNLVTVFYNTFKDEIRKEELPVLERVAGINKLKNRLGLAFYRRKSFKAILRLRWLINRY
jgi:rhamnosyltransferase